MTQREPGMHRRPCRPRHVHRAWHRRRWIDLRPVSGRSSAFGLMVQKAPLLAGQWGPGRALLDVDIDGNLWACRRPALTRFRWPRRALVQDRASTARPLSSRTATPRKLVSPLPSALVRRWVPQQPCALTGKNSGLDRHAHNAKDGHRAAVYGRFSIRAPTSLTGPNASTPFGVDQRVWDGTSSHRHIPLASELDAARAQPPRMVHGLTSLRGAVILTGRTRHAANGEHKKSRQPRKPRTGFSREASHDHRLA